MPAIVGAIQVITVSSSSVFNIGDVHTINPYTSAKTFAGGGSFNTGTNINVQLDRSAIETPDPDIVDQPIIGQ